MKLLCLVRQVREPPLLQAKRSQKNPQKILLCGWRRDIEDMITVSLSFDSVFPCSFSPHAVAGAKAIPAQGRYASKCSRKDPFMWLAPGHSGHDQGDWQIRPITALGSHLQRSLADFGLLFT